MAWPDKKRDRKEQTIIPHYMKIYLDILPSKSLADAQHMVKRQELFKEANQKLNVHEVKIMKPDKFLKK